MITFYHCFSIAGTGTVGHDITDPSREIYIIRVSIRIQIEINRM
jgi:hypothetical protein